MASKFLHIPEGCIAHPQVPFVYDPQLCNARDTHGNLVGVFATTEQFLEHTFMVWPGEPHPVQVVGKISSSVYQAYDDGDQFWIRLVEKGFSSPISGTESGKWFKSTKSQNNQLWLDYAAKMAAPKAVYTDHPLAPWRWFSGTGKVHELGTNEIVGHFNTQEYFLEYQPGPHNGVFKVVTYSGNEYLAYKNKKHQLWLKLVHMETTTGCSTKAQKMKWYHAKHGGKSHIHALYLKAKEAYEDGLDATSLAQKVTYSISIPSLSISHKSSPITFVAARNMIRHRLKFLVGEGGRADIAINFKSKKVSFSGNKEKAIEWLEAIVA